MVCFPPILSTGTVQGKSAQEGKALLSRAAGQEYETQCFILEKKQTVPDREGFREEAILALALERWEEHNKAEEKRNSRVLQGTVLKGSKENKVFIFVFILQGAGQS